MSIVGTVWRPVGPSPIAEGGNQDNGLVTVIAVNPNNPDILYIGTAGGGVWRSDDGGKNWQPLFDRQLSLGIGEPNGIAIDPNNTDVIYVGTSGRVSRQPQAGLFKSTDGGGSWMRLGSGVPAGNVGNATQFASQFINVIIVDPADSNTVYLGSSSGFFRSTDGGRNWTQGASANGDVRSIVVDFSSPAGARLIYAGISGRGAFRSSDGGQTWTQMLSATTPVVAGLLAGGGIGKVIVAIPPPSSPANPAGVQIIYATMQGTGTAPDPVGLFQSTDQGNTWTQRPAAGMPGNTQGGYSFHMAVDPASPGDGVNDIIYFGTVGQRRSTDAGNSFAAIPVLHADTHAWTFVPRAAPAPSIIYCGNDGGINRSTDNGATWTALNAGGMQTTLFYNLDVRPDASASVSVAAAQDNEIQSTAGAVGLTWNGTQGGDGWDVAYDQVVPSRVYCTSGFWSPAPCTRVFRSNDDGATFPTEITPWGTTSDAGCYLAPITTDPSNGGFVYVSGSQNLWQSRDGGSTWRILSPFNSTGNIDVARANGNNVVIAVGGKVFVSTNALAATVGPPTGVTFTDITRNLPGRFVARALFDPADPGTIFAVLGGFSGFPGGHVFRTTITASAWTDISPAIDLPFSALALSAKTTPTTIIAGTDIGVVRSVDDGASWTVLDDIHFPRAPVLDLILNDDAGILRAATYGRGVFQFSKPNGPAIAVNLEDGLDFGVVCKGPKSLTLEIFNVGIKDLEIISVAPVLSPGSFSVLAAPGTPLIVSPGDHVDFTIDYTPGVRGITENATIRILSNDPGAPIVDVVATGFGGTGTLEALIADGGNIGNACLGSYADATLTINNNGPCLLSINGIFSSSAEFTLPLVAAYPLVIGAGDSIDVTVRFKPSSFGGKAAMLAIVSDDPSSPTTLNVSGVALAPALALMMPGDGRFAHTCVGSFSDEPLALNNNGRCTLSVSGIASSSPEFAVPEVLAYPLTIAAGTSLYVPIRFQPSGIGPKTATITVASDDPAGPKSIDVWGDVPGGELRVTGSGHFGGVECGKLAERTLTVCNVGECPLHVESVALNHRRRHFRILNNPFPATVARGSGLDVVIEFEATCDPPRPCDLVIKSDDAHTPVRCIELWAYSLCCVCTGCGEGCCECRDCCGCRCSCSCGKREGCDCGCHRREHGHGHHGEHGHHGPPHEHGRRHRHHDHDEDDAHHHDHDHHHHHEHDDDP